MICRPTKIRNFPSDATFKLSLKKLIFIRYDIFFYDMKHIDRNTMTDKYIVLKFGGSSQCKQGMEVIVNKIKEYKNDHKVILVISAVGKTTNNLYGLTNCEADKYQIIYDVHKKFCENIDVDFSLVEPLLEELKDDFNKYVNKPFVDITQQKLKIISYGECIASKIVHHYLMNNDVKNIFLNAHLFMKNKHASTEIDVDTLNIKGEFMCDNNILLNLIKEHDVSVTQGFIANTSDNKYCVLTRSGSNTSASLIASAINAVRLEIWTDVNGLYTADPRKILGAKMIPFIKYNVCQEAAAMGSQIIHPYSIKPCESKHIPIHIRNTFDPLGGGTIINGNNFNDDKYNVHLISYQGNVTVFQITSLDMWESYGFVHDIFSVFKDEKIDVNIITTSQFSITTTTNEKSLKKIISVTTELNKKYDVNVIDNCAIVSIIADHVSHNKKIQSIHQLIDELDEPIYVTHYGSNDMTLSYVVNESYAHKLINMLHNNLI